MQATVTLKSHQKQGRKRPVVHVLMADGRVTEFKDRAIAIPEGHDGVFAVLVDRNGEPYVDPNGKPVVVPVPIVALGVVPDPNKLISWKQVAELAGVSLSTAERLVSAGSLPKPVKLGKRKVGFRQGDVAEAHVVVEFWSVEGAVVGSIGLQS